MKPKKSIDKVTTEYLDIALRMYGIQLSKEIIDVTIDLVELIEEKGGEVTISDVSKLKGERGKGNVILNADEEEANVFIDEAMNMA